MYGAFFTGCPSTTGGDDGDTTTYTPSDPTNPADPTNPGNGDPTNPGGTTTYTVTFDPDGGTVEGSTGVAAQTVTAGGKATNPGDAVKAGHTFSGWFNGDAKWDFESGTVSANLTLKAGWDLVLHTVTFNSNGGTPAPTDQAIAQGGTATQPAAMTKANYDFDDWYAASDFSGSAWNFTSDTVTGNITLNAKWTPTSYTITYNLNGGTNHASNPAAYTIESAAITLEAPSKTYYDFGGWYTEAGFTNQVTGIAIAAGSTGAKTFWAKWTPLPPNSWTQVEDSQFSGRIIRGVTYGGPAGQEKFVAVGAEGKIAYSADGVTWSAVTNSRFSQYDSIRGVTYGGSAGQEKFVAVGTANLNGMAYSADGVSWTAVPTSSFNVEIAGVTYGNGKFVAVGEMHGKMGYSANGTSWTQVSSSPFSNTINGITYCGPVGQEKFVAVAPGGAMSYSTDGTTWKTVLGQNMIFAGIGTSSISCVTYGGPAGQEKFLAVGGGGKMAYLTDGLAASSNYWTAWREVTTSTFDPDNGGINCVTYGGTAGQEKFVAVGSSGQIAWSADGVTWTAVTESSFDVTHINGVTYGNGRFVAVGQNGKIAYSNPQE